MSNPYDNARDAAKSVLGPTLKFKGELIADEDLLIQGQIQGKIKHSSTLRIGEEGKVKANVTAEYISVEGSVKGDITGKNSVKVHEGANVDGNIYSPSVSLLEGATFNGSIDMSGEGKSQSKPKPESQNRSNDKVVASDKSSDSSGADVKSDSDKKDSKQQKASANAA